MSEVHGSQDKALPQASGQRRLERSKRRLLVERTKGTEWRRRTCEQEPRDSRAGVGKGEAIWSDRHNGWPGGGRKGPGKGLGLEGAGRWDSQVFGPCSVGSVALTKVSGQGRACQLCALERP